MKKLFSERKVVSGKWQVVRTIYLPLATCHFLPLITLLFLLTACDLTKPAYMSLNPPDGPPEYRQGWADGCESARDAMASSFYKAFLTVHQDEDLMKSPVYSQVWHDAYEYCYIYQDAINGNGLGNGK